MKKFSNFSYLVLLCIIFGAFNITNADDQLVHRNIHFMNVSKTNVAPALNGSLDDACWKNSVKVADFVLTAGKHGTPAKQPTEAYVCYDESFLYVAFKCYDDEIENIKSISYRTDDTDILYDDRVEIFLDVNHDHRSYWELAVNPKGVQFDQTAYNRLHGSKTCDMFPEKNLFWRAKTKVYDTYWTAEIAIEFYTLGIEKIEKGTTFGFNLARARQPDIDPGEEFFKEVPHGAAEYSAWAPVSDFIRETISNFQAPAEFGDLVFGDPGFKVEEFAFNTMLYAFGPMGFPSEYGWNPLEIKLNAASKKNVLMKLSVAGATFPQWNFEETLKFSGEQTIKTRYWIPEDLENLITIQLVDPKSGKQLYKTTYWELTAPFIQYNLDPLYTRTPSVLEPVQFKLLTDDETITKTSLKLSFIDPATEKVIETESIEDLSKAQDFQPIFDIDELRALKGGNYVIDAVLSNKASGKKMVSFRQNFTKFALKAVEKFHAVEGDYSFGGITDEAIRILYPSGVELSFWKKASFAPLWDVDEICVSNEFIEEWGAGNQGCNEPMQDRECRYSRVELLENTDARVVVHWRYALSDPHYNIYHNEWVDEYYTLYPDEIGTREINLWANSDTRHEMFEILLVKPPGVETHQLFDKEFATLSNLEGKGYSNIWLNENRKFHQEFVKESQEMVVEVHLKDRPHTFTIFALRPELLPGVTPDHVAICARDVGHADRRGHWPASRFQIDGYNTPGLDVPHHGNIGNIQAEVDPKNQPTTWTYVIGMMEEGSQTPYDAAKSWLYAGEMVSKSKDVKSTGYVYSERAYGIKANKKVKKIELALEGNKSPILNPTLLIKNLTKEIKSVDLDGQAIDTANWASGKTRDGELVLFVETMMGAGQIITINLK